MAGEVFGPYRLVARLGAGGMGEVWRAVDTVKDREVAVKVMVSALAAQPGYAERFRREAALAARLNAPNIIPIHDYGEIDGRLFIEMPVINGTDLAAVIARDGALGRDRAVAVVEQVADAIDTAHEAGLVHRDVKPSNVLLATRPNGRDVAYLIDFGIAMASGGTPITLTGQQLGTLAYMAPERFAGEDDPRGDIYALACVLVHAVTGSEPFPLLDRAHPQAFYLHAHLHRPPPKPSDRDPTLPTALDDVVARGMAKDPAARYPSAGALAAAARAALIADPPARPLAPGAETIGPEESVVTVVAPRPGPVPSGPVPSGRRRAGIVAGALVVALVVAALAAVALIRSGRSTTSGVALPILTTPILTTPIAAAPTTPAAVPIANRTITGFNSPVNAVATAELDGRPVVVSGSADDLVRVWDLATGALVGAPFSGHTDTVTSLVTAQLDGRTVVVSGSFDKTVRVWDLATGAPVGAPFAGHTDAVVAVATAQLDGRPVVVSGSFDDTVRVSDLATGAAVGSPLVGHTDRVFAVTTAQLGSRTVVVSASFDNTVRMWDLATGVPIGSPLTGHTDTVVALAATTLNGRTVVVTGGADKTVRVWDLATGAPVGAPFTGHTDIVRAVAIAQLGGRPVVVSGSFDKTVRVWDLATGTPVGTPFTGHTDDVSCVAVAAVNGRSVAVSGGSDQTVRVWDLGR